MNNTEQDTNQLFIQSCETAYSSLDKGFEKLLEENRSLTVEKVCIFFSYLLKYS